MSLSKFNDSKSKYISYVQNIYLDKGTKSKLLDNSFIEENPRFYMYYPKLFVNKQADKTIDKLCIAGYLYYMCNIFLDSVLDNNNSENLLLAFTCQEESIKLLTEIYGLKSGFWRFWDIRKKEYIEAVIQEKRTNNKDEICFSDYADIAKKKSAFGKAAIDAVSLLFSNEDSDFHKRLLKSHDFFSIAFQMNDDIQDIVEDHDLGQFNWALYVMKEEGDLDVETLNKLFYINGYYKSTYKKAIEFIDLALQEVQFLDVPHWISLLNKTKKTLSNSKIEVDNYLKILTKEIEHSEIFLEKNTLSLSINKAKKYILSNQEESGEWNEYINQGGISSTWSTAFILTVLSSLSDKEYFKISIEKALGFLLKSKNQDSLWGYNSTWISDCDTTNFVMLSLFLNNKNIEDSTINNWSAFQKTDGGFSTYKSYENLLTSLDDNNINDVSGWVDSHQCVSAVSWYFLVMTHKGTKEQLLLLRNYFKRHSVSSVFSYWWTSSIYTIYYLAKVYTELKLTDELEILLDEIKKKQLKDGSFTDGYGSNLFFTAMGMEVLMLNFSKYKDLIEKAKKFLLKNQFNDGSWGNSHSLRVPNPENDNYKKIELPISKKGVNVRCKEFNRLFTTTMILNSFSIYAERNLSS